jgi:hypothetical protein
MQWQKKMLRERERLCVRCVLNARRITPDNALLELNGSKLVDNRAGDVRCGILPLLRLKKLRGDTLQDFVQHLQ